ncbi:GIY-YIG nuclease family protein [bacterium]|nr:GIY-YIG nuclease family protein [bacterium]
MSARLSDLEVLVLDCQATGANPEKGHLLEIGWAPFRASETGNETPCPAESCLVALPDNADIPRQVTRITGITRTDLVSADTPAGVWEKLDAAADTVAKDGGLKTCPTVIHFARFEEPFLRHLHGQNSAHTPFPLDIVCTHELVIRLLPYLPRRGLRAIAGYFGYSVAELRRSADHVDATAFIWKNLLDLLEDEHGITTLDELREWLSNTEAFPRSGRFYPMNPGLRLDVPDVPGVYRMLRSNGDVLYVGKARSLRRRVNSYFQKRNGHGEHILEMLTQAVNIDVTVTASALEAAVLESDEIKRLSPPYNISLRDRDRTIWFSSDDLVQFSERADEYHPVGPLPAKESLAPLARIAGLVEHGGMNGQFDEQACSGALGIPAPYIPDIDCFRSGFDMFLRRHSDMLSEKTGIQALFRLGAHLWRERIRELSPEESDENGTGSDMETAAADEGIPAEQPSWTSESTVDALEHVIIRGAHAARRARWFCLLSESSLAWEAENSAHRRKNLVVFEKGSLIYRTDLASGKEAHIPPGYKRQFQERRQSFTVATYDRMRVVTTELRRLVAGSRNIELRLGPSSILHNEHLERTLEWV